jgi:hypothetical protein
VERLLLIVDIVLENDSNDLFDETRMAFDLLMMAHTTGGKERTELEWKKLLEEAGFGRYKIIKIPTIPSIIEAYPEWHTIFVVKMLSAQHKGYLMPSFIVNEQTQ